MTGFAKTVQPAVVLDPDFVTALGQFAKADDLTRQTRIGLDVFDETPTRFFDRLVSRDLPRSLGSWSLRNGGDTKWRLQGMGRSRTRR